MPSGYTPFCILLLFICLICAVAVEKKNILRATNELKINCTLSPCSVTTSLFISQINFFFLIFQELLMSSYFLWQSLHTVMERKLLVFTFLFVDLFIYLHLSFYYPMSCCLECHNCYQHYNKITFKGMVSWEQFQWIYRSRICFVSRIIRIECLKECILV